MKKFVDYFLKSYLYDPRYCFTGAFAKPSNFEFMHDIIVFCGFVFVFLMI